MQEDNPVDAPEEEEKVSLTTEAVETPSTDMVVRRWEEHIKRIGATRVRKKTMKLVQLAMSASGQQRIDYLRAAVKLEPKDKAIGEMLIQAEKSMAAAKRKRKNSKANGKTRPATGPAPQPTPNADVVVKPRIIED